MVSNEELRRALRLCVEQMCRYCRAEARAQGLPQCLEGCETLKIAKAALATDDEGETAVRKGELSKMASKNGADFGQFGNETWADIVAEMRRAKEQCNGATALFSAWLDEWADRIEAAAKRAYNEIDSAVCSIEDAASSEITAVCKAMERTLGDYYE